MNRGRKRIGNREQDTGLGIGVKKRNRETVPVPPEGCVSATKLPRSENRRSRGSGAVVFRDKVAN